MFNVIERQHLSEIKQKSEPAFTYLYFNSNWENFQILCESWASLLASWYRIKHWHSICFLLTVGPIYLARPAWGNYQPHANLLQFSFLTLMSLTEWVHNKQVARAYFGADF